MARCPPLATAVAIPSCTANLLLCFARLLGRPCLVLILGSCRLCCIPGCHSSRRRLAIPRPQRGPGRRQLAFYSRGVGDGAYCGRWGSPHATATCAAAGAPHIADRQQAAPAAGPRQWRAPDAGPARALCWRCRRRRLRCLALAGLRGGHLLSQRPGAGDALHNRDGDGGGRPAGRREVQQACQQQISAKAACLFASPVSPSPNLSPPPPHVSARPLTSPPQVRRAGCLAAACPCAAPPAAPDAGPAGAR